MLGAITLNFPPASPSYKETCAVFLLPQEAWGLPQLHSPVTQGIQDMFMELNQTEQTFPALHLLTLAGGKESFPGPALTGGGGGATEVSATPNTWPRAWPQWSQLTWLLWELIQP